MTRRTAAAARVHDIEPDELGQAPRAVIVALDARRPPLAALRMGRLVASALEAPLHGLFAWHAPIHPADVARLCGLAPDSLGGLVLDTEIGEAGDRLIAAANATPDALLVVGSPRAADEPLGIAPVVARALAASPAATIIVRDDLPVPEELNRILLPLDGRPSTAGAIGVVGELARQAGAELDIVYVGTTGRRSVPPDQAEPGSMGAPQYVDQPQHEWPAFSDEFLHRFLQAIGHCPDDVPTRMFLGAGEPAREILRYADELACDLLALVWHGDLLASHGEVFAQVMREARCPVLVLKR